MRPAPSASPPIQNGLPYNQRQHTPQAATASRFYGSSVAKSLRNVTNLASCSRIHWLLGHRSRFASREQLALAGLIKAGTDSDQVGTELNRAQITFHDAIDDHFNQLQLQIDNKNKAIRFMLEQKIETYGVMSTMQNELVLQCLQSMKPSAKQMPMTTSNSRVVTALVLQKQSCYPNDTVVLRAEEQKRRGAM
ncbi:hypothetical protein JMJ35_000722 [Cladonia borealis]|uniref:Uncharacterized protein n=1 Tax=Cladonia borealis TaxID=184061 RepID=A0AA39R9T0_9LECA|nr:hypothetical protein JMJ35_000722 [Cladonia borealis]